VNQAHPASRKTSVLALGALGVVFGDIGTSPLYTLKEVFGGHHLALSQDNVLGILSLVFWELILVVSVKYVGIMMRADNKGEAASLPCSRWPVSGPTGVAQPLVPDVAGLPRGLVLFR